MNTGSKLIVLLALAGAGAAVLVLKHLDDAIADGNRIFATIRGIGIANDGAARAAFSAPSVDGQAAALAAALDDASVSPADIGFVEGHGTATALGDPIEVAALTRAFREGTQRTGFARLGSIKPTIGHLDTAAGVASVIKTATALRERILPPLSNYTGSNPLIGLENTPFVLSGSPAPWERGTEPRRAGVSPLPAAERCRTR